MIFTGRIKQEEIPQLATKCVYAINYIPNIYPFNIQTSTKLLEYAAMDLKIITTDYWWVRNFELENNMKFYKIDEDFSNFHYAELTKISAIRAPSNFAMSVASSSVMPIRRARATRLSSI